jgi:ornithine cyclodeaminase/alanine dehydrogenase-like protein (mu-crystallin family)
MESSCQGIQDAPHTQRRQDGERRGLTTVRRARLFVDRRESALAEAGDLLIPIQEGAVGEEHIVGELGDLLLGLLPGRRSAEEITLFESLGLAVEDLAAARHVWRKSLR